MVVSKILTSSNKEDLAGLLDNHILYLKNIGCTDITYEFSTCYDARVYQVEYSVLVVGIK